MTDIEKLIPQRSPIRMVDELLCVNEEEAQTCLTIGHDNFFLTYDEGLIEAGIIEHIAQSASAVAGYKVLQASSNGSSSSNEQKPPVGVIGEIKKFNLYHQPHVGDKLITTITTLIDMGNVSVVKGVTKVGDETYADVQLKIFIS